MDFFEAQDDARSRTRMLVFLYGLAVLGLAALANLLVLAVLVLSGTAPSLAAAFSWSTVGAITAGVMLVVALGSWAKLRALAGGGRVVAEMLGGRLVPRDTSDPTLKRLLNIVDEMAIASGTPSPPVYLMDRELGINAFAAGLTVDDAVIGVTLGTVRELSRDHLQGVIAHEFSHIVAGDMRLNTRLIGINHGILLIGQIGAMLLRGGSYAMIGGGYRRSRRNSNQSGMPILVIGLGLMAIGYGGTLFGRIIQAGVSRQREFLADAQAVRFTRNPDGIGGALKRIGGLTAGSRMAHPAAAEASHALFGAISKMGGPLASHPPLATRIRRIDPRWDGTFDTRPPTPLPDEQISGERTLAGGMAHATRIPLDVGYAGAVESTGSVARGPGEVSMTIDGLAQVAAVGRPTAAHLDQARRLLAQIPAALRDAAAEPFTARSVIHGLLLSADPDARARQLEHLNEHAERGVDADSKRLAGVLASLDPATAQAIRLPLIDLSLPSLRALTAGQLDRFQNNRVVLTELDTGVSLFTWSLGKVLDRHLRIGSRPTQAARDHLPLTRVRRETAVVLSVLAHADGDGAANAADDFAAALPRLQLPGVELIPWAELRMDDLEHALERLGALSPLHKRRLLSACVACIHADGVVDAREAELLRAVADVLDCPMPPAAWGR